ncbi:MAG: tRNA (adenosine(37)-N6)-threonylcarbamoyltransferase complex transferase subunit TsaD [Candidatus Omnitrophica bacterium]|nr:tRNA (adenosine(37)-N6)-threonylcarbamoyltransferase complex transferase subunit TsaD [Candidatus Omnitrophota bacterium]MCM8799307.1 tRNA (adenosine(37)-N6)-threonylcarbamoyltransferase complex transferase subunit TsaD [Candidatus Omnitrophota bacterium]
MNVLGIETSCDETAISLVKDGKRIVCSELASSLKFHKKYGGIVPEIASRMHLEVISYLFKKVLLKSKLIPKDIDLVAVTYGPGLVGSLLVGVSFAKAISFALNIPLVGINHLHGHLYAAFLERKNLSLKFPFIGLVVSGGHTSLFYVKDFKDIQLLGSTLDDACGEALDKVARLLGLGYPGGPYIEKLAKEGDLRAIRFSNIKTNKPLDFSFSGIKTAVLYYLKDKGYHPETGKVISYPIKLIRDICASFQERIFDNLIEKSFLACEMKNTKRLVVGGGVAVNNRLREKFIQEANNKKIDVYFAPKPLCLDNAVMIAGLGYFLFKEGKCDNLDLEVRASI